MGFPWALTIGLVVLALAFGIKHFVNETVEAQKTFFVIIGAFFAIYIGAAFAINYLNPTQFVSANTNDNFTPSSLAP